MINAARFSAKLHCWEMETLFERLQDMVPSIAEVVVNDEGSYFVRFAGGEAKLRGVGNLLSIEIEADDAELCMGIRVALAATLVDHLVEPAMILASQCEG